MNLLAVRHGQAAFDAADYDQLSERGHEQTRRLGAWLLAQDLRFDRVVTGTLRRHAQSLAAIAAVYAEAGLRLPEPELEPGFDEFDHRRVLQAFAAHAPDHPAVRAAAAGRPSLREIGALLDAALSHWVSGVLDAACEPWMAFRERARAAGTRWAAHCCEASVLLISSGGVISQLAAAALDVPDQRAVQLNLSLRNSALSEFHAGPDGLRLASWNALPHLADARELWTYV